VWEFFGRLVFQTGKVLISLGERIKKAFDGLKITFNVIAGIVKKIFKPFIIQIQLLGVAFRAVFNKIIKPFFKSIVINAEFAFIAIRTLIQSIVDSLGKFAPKALVDGLKGLAKATENTFKGLKKRITGTIGGIGSDFKNLAKDVIKTVNGIFTETKKKPPPIGPNDPIAPGQPSENQIVKASKKTSKKVKKTWQDTASDLVGSLKGIATKISPEFSQIGDLINGVAQSILKNFKDPLSAVTGVVDSVVGFIVDEFKKGSEAVELSTELTIARIEEMPKN
jgi:gas vesicle protein